MIPSIKEVILLLLRKAANIEIANKEGETFKTILENSGNQQILKELIEEFVSQFSKDYLSQTELGVMYSDYID